MVGFGEIKDSKHTSQINFGGSDKTKISRGQLWESISQQGYFICIFSYN
jgi:hypothetical protein